MSESGTGSSGGRRRGLSRRGFVKGAAVGAGLAASDLALLSHIASAAPNRISEENALAGNSDWDMDIFDESIEGFPTEFSVNAGAAIGFKIRTPSANYRIDIFRLGWYGGSGARKVATVLPSVALPQTQPDPSVDEFTGLVDCGKWAVSATWNVPVSATSGVYVANLVRLDQAGNPSNRLLFVVRNDGVNTDLLVQTSDTTYQAYNEWGGNSLYKGTANWGRAVKVSYNRPMSMSEIENSFFYAELPLLRWLERNGYDVAYTSNIDTDRRPAELLRHKVFVSSGHDEYWSGAMRANVEAARNAGVHLIFMTGNEVFWKVRFESSVDGTGTAYKTLVCYKETLENAKVDPSPEWTGTWRDGRFSPPSNGGRPENALTGTLFKAINPLNSPDFAIKVPYEYSRLRMWRNTSIATLPAGSTATLSPATLGYEWNTDGDFPARPKGLIRLSQTTETAEQVLQDNGGTYITAPLTHYVTMYRAASGALVWSTGTCQWAWGLESYHLNRPDDAVPTDSRMQQATINVLADMGVQPATRQSGLAAATQSTDTVPPLSTITSPAAGAGVPVGSPVTVSGTATDSGGGQVAGVEVSTDGGATWHPAIGRAAWTYTFTPMALGNISLRTRATDDSCNTENPGAGRTIVGVDRAVPCSIFAAGSTPAVPAANDATPLELGVRFRADRDGFVSAIRFYKGAGNGGTHIGRLWTNSGALLATTTFTNETASGWQTAPLSPPVAISAGVAYVASYQAPVGRYSVDSNFFATDYALAPLRAPASGGDGPNGVYSTTPGSFPNSTWGASNYWVDVLFDADDHIAPTVVSSSPGRGVSSVDTGSRVEATFSEAMNATSIAIELRDSTGALVPATGAYVGAARTYVLTPTAPLNPSAVYTATVTSAIDASGQTMAAPFAWTFTTAGPVGTYPASIWTSAAVPALPAVNDSNPVELGVRFKADFDGLIAGLRFFKGEGNGGAHLGRLWSVGGALLGTATFAQESATGWQEAAFASAIAVTAGETYVASYFAPQGHYSADGGYFGSAATTRGPLHALQSVSGAENGLYLYGAAGGFPVNSWGAANYWVDVVYARSYATTAPVLLDRSPAPSIEAVATSATVTATFDVDLDPSASSIVLQGAGGAVAGTSSYDAATRTIRFSPSAPLATATTYTATASARNSQGGAAMTPVTWTFTTAAPAGAHPVTLWDSSFVPAVVDAQDGGAVELGMKFRVDVDGAVAAVRYYKAAANTGAHVGHLWSADGALLATAVFSNETMTGWQQANFDTPVGISAGQTYVASYHAPNGHYSADGGGLASGVDRPPLHALPSAANGGNGLYRYGAGGFPNSTFNAANYWVDVVFVDRFGPSVVGTSPAAQSTGVAVTATVSATFSEAVQPSSIGFALRDGQGALVGGAISYDAASRSATFTPSSPLAGNATFTATVSGAIDAMGNPMAAPVSWSFSTMDTSLLTLFGSDVPATASANDPGAVEVGMKFRSAANGEVRGIRFYKGPSNSGQHVGSLWTADGTLLASVTFGGESPTGWQQAMLSTPVAIQANTIYIVSCFDPNGGYSVNGGFFNPGDFTRGPLTGLGNFSATPNGVYKYGGGFPTGSYGGSNYWVDVVFVQS